MKTNIRKTYKYRLYRCDKRDKYLHDKINIAGIIWNHCLALQKRYYKLTGKYISKYTMQKHIGQLRSKSPRFAYWKKLGSQTTQLITHKLDDAYQRFFKKLAKRPPRFRKVKLYRSITFTQAGWKLENNKLWIQGKVYLDC
jgi:putative transposase